MKKDNVGGKIIIIFASTVKEAKEIANKECNGRLLYVAPYKYSKGKGNNFYEFILKVN